MKKANAIAPAGEKKYLAGVAARIGAETQTDPILARLGFLGTFLFIEWEIAVVAYIAMGLYFAFFHGRSSDERRSERTPRTRRGSVHDARTKLDARDRRMMAIDHHLNSADSQRLDAEIAALREKVAARNDDAAKPAEKAETPADGEAKGEAR